VTTPPPFVKVSQGMLPVMRLLTKGSAAPVYFCLVLMQGEDGIVDADEVQIMAALDLSAATIARTLSYLESVGLIQPTPPRIRDVRSYSLTGDLSRRGPGAPTAHCNPVAGARTVLQSGIRADQNSFDSCSSSSLPDLKTKTQDQDERQLPLPLAPQNSFAVGADPGGNADAGDNPFALFEREKFGELTPFVADTLGMLIDESGAEAVIDALRIAVMANVRTMSYVKGVLRKKATEQAGGEPGNPGASRFLTGKYAGDIRH